MISVNNLSIHFTGDYLFEHVSFVIGDHDKIGLVGKNGAGKTTLLNILSKQLEPQSGTIVYTAGHRVGYLRQEMQIFSTKTIWEEASTAFAELNEIERKINQLTQQIADSTDYESEDYNSKINSLEELNRRAVYLGAGSMNAELEKVLLGLGFKKEDFARKVSEFSSGWQMRLELAKILLRKTEILLLDEPTNHLDIESIQWLENFLKNYFGAVIMVSHDRVFLDNVCQRTIEITLGHIEDYNCSYSDYVTRRAERIEHQKQVFDNQQKEIAEIESFIERFRYKATKAKQVQSRLKLLEKMDVVQVDETDNSQIHFLFPKAPPCSRVVFDIKDMSMGYEPDKILLHNLDFTILKGEKIAFVGRNGEGKTTLVKLLRQELHPNSGTIEVSNMVKVGYFAQDHNRLLNPQKTVFETIDDVATGDMRLKIRAILGAFLFSNDDMDKKVAVLSGGEKSRLVIAKLLLEPYNVLILDEPTNHLDMRSKDVLKNALLHYDGTLIVVSHDRDFLQGLTDKVIEVRDGGIKEYIGDIQYYLEKRNMTTLQAEAVKNKEMAKPDTGPTEQKRSWQEQKQKESNIRKLAKKIEEVEATISAKEDLMKEISEKLTQHERYAKEIASGELYQNYQSAQEQLNAAMEEWEQLSEQMILLTQE